MDILGEFIEERCAVGSFNKTQASPLYEAFVSWHKKNRGGNPITQTAFGRRLAERGFTREKGRGAFFWCGISISETDEERAESGFWKGH
jgi:putative DNA primase/helicase